MRTRLFYILVVFLNTSVNFYRKIIYCMTIKKLAL